MQYGFRRESFTEFAVLDLVSCYNENINDKLFTGFIMIDLKKSFGLNYSFYLAAKTKTLRFSW